MDLFLLRLIVAVIADVSTGAPFENLKNLLLPILKENVGSNVIKCVHELQRNIYCTCGI